MDRKKTILRIARKHFSRYGYSKTTMEEVARDCEITKPTLYSHFTGKAELFRAVIDNEQEECYSMIEQAVAGLESASDKLRAYADMQIESIKRFINIGELSTQAFLDFHPEVIRVYTIYRKKEEGFIRNWIESGVQSKEFDQVDAASAARSYYLHLAALKFDILVFNNFEKSDILSEEEKTDLLKKEIDRFVNLFLQGLLRRDNAL